MPSGYDYIRIQGSPPADNEAALQRGFRSKIRQWMNDLKKKKINKANRHAYYKAHQNSKNLETTYKLI